ncbi:MAG: hypothetical protein FWD60_11950 [Candidatus Azobacteroides sp.]|nr:hypothetical protein [Candidatus Azobacteroides sp.]
MKDLFNFGTFFRFLYKNKLYTLINIFGLSLSLMFVILIAVYVKQELSTDCFHSKANRIYALGNETNFGAAYRLANRIKERYPKIEKVCPIAPWLHESTVLVHEPLAVRLFLPDKFESLDFYCSRSLLPIGFICFCVLAKSPSCECQSC